MPKSNKKRYYRDEKRLTLVGLKIREIRLAKNISQEDLANECEVDYSQINRMELGKVNFSVSFLFKIADGLQVNAEELLPK